MAENVLYAQVEGTNMTLKYGEKPSNTETVEYYDYDGSAGWNSSFMTTIQTATVDASCANFDGNSTRSLFDGFSKLIVINDIDKLNTANVENMNNMFASCSSLTTLDLHSLNTAKVTNMSMMFYLCSGLTSLRVSSWNTANVTNMNQMFDGCSALALLNLSSWNTAKVTYMTSMFQGCSALVTIYVGSGWNTDDVTSSSLMFNLCTNIKGSDGTIYDPSKLDKTYARIGDGGENKGYMSDATMKINLNLAEGRRWTTWYSDAHTYVIDAEEDADAYAAEYDAGNSCLTLHKIDDGKIIPAKQGVIIVADKDNESVSMTIDDFASVDMPKNDLNGCETEESLSDIILRLDDVEYWDEAGNVYVMGMVDGKFGFYKYVNLTMPAHKAFLYIPQTTESSSARAITLSFADNITDVKTVSGDKGQWSMFNGQCSDWYTINGVKLSGKPTAPGMYINSGKKIIIK
jgi:surface protein